MKHSCWILVLVANLCASAFCFAQNSGGTPPTTRTPEPPSETTKFHLNRNNWGLLPPGTDPQNRLGVPFLKHLVQDQETFWTSPLRFKKRDIVPAFTFAAITGGLMVGDSWLSKQVPDSPSSISRSQSVSNYLAYSMVAGTAAMYAWGHLTKDDHKRETGLLATEAVLNSTAVTYLFKTSFARERPFVGTGSGAFFSGGDSFPSEHSAIAWSIASVVAHEYPGWLTQVLAYGAATGISLTRVTGKEHFPSDVVVGGALGWYFGRQIYRARHDRSLGGAAWGSTEPDPPDETPHRNDTGSPNVPLDSWVYPAVDRLIAAGYVQSEMLGMRPWTRRECARLIEDARERMPIEGPSSEMEIRIYRALEKEFEPEINEQRAPGARLESIYTRVTGISGPPLTDGYNFARTITNDFGRPFQEGLNSVSGVSGYAVAGPFTFYARAEYQHSPSALGESDTVRNAIASQLAVPAVPYADVPAVNRMRLLEGYASFQLADMQFSFGKQALSWGPSRSGSMMWSTNAEPIPMFRITSTRPFVLPSFFHYLGGMRVESFFGKLDGQQFILTSNGTVGPYLRGQPYVYGQKLSFKPSENLEFGFSRTVMFAGQGHPLTFGNFFTSFTSVGDNGSGALNVRTDVGDRRSGFDVSYRVPYLRKWLTVYTDSFCDDDVSPLSAPQRCAWNPGFYLSHIPKVSKLDFRAEGITTDVSGFGSAQGINYYNIVYPSGYTNDGNILGNAIGREGRGVQLWSTYWLSPQSKLQASYRHVGVNRNFLQGGHLDDFSIAANWRFRSGLEISGSTQFEHWNFPLLAPATKSNVAVSIGVTYWPSWLRSNR